MMRTRATHPFFNPLLCTRTTDRQRTQLSRLVTHQAVGDQNFQFVLVSSPSFVLQQKLMGEFSCLIQPVEAFGSAHLGLGCGAYL